MDNNSHLAQPSSITQSRPAVGLAQSPAGAANAGGGSSGFDAGGIKPLDYNLRPYVEASGTVPEPTRKRQADFTRRMTKLANVQGMPEIEGLSPEDQQKAIRENPALIDTMLDRGDEAEDEIRSAVADLCAGSPTKEQIDELPPRVFLAFSQWIQGEMLPEA